MKWRRRREPDSTPVAEPDRSESGIEEAQQALEHALSRWPEVNATTELIRGIRRRNHLAEITERALRGSR